MNNFYTRICSLVLLTFIVGCSGTSESDYSSPSAEFKTPENLPQYSKEGFACPTVGIIEDLRSITLFGDNNKPNDKSIAGYAKIEDFSGSCAFEGGFVEVNMDVLFSAKSGTRVISDRVTESTIAFPYFIAVADEAGNILRKEVFAVAMRFQENKDTTRQSDTIKPRIPLANPQAGQSYQVLIGFQLTREQLNFNRGD